MQRLSDLLRKDEDAERKTENSTMVRRSFLPDRVYKKKMTVHLNKNQGGNKTPVVTLRHVQEAFRSSTPSVSTNERKRYEAMYAYADLFSW